MQRNTLRGVLTRESSDPLNSGQRAEQLGKGYFRRGESARHIYDNESVTCDGRRNYPNQAAHLLRFAGGSSLCAQCLYLRFCYLFGNGVVLVIGCREHDDDYVMARVYFFFVGIVIGCVCFNYRS